MIAARPTTENFYRSRVVVPATKTSQPVTAADLGLSAGVPFYVSVASIDAQGHESLFAYPELRCTTAGCMVPADALDVTAMK